MDLAEIWAYIAVEASEEVATGFLARLTDACQSLVAFPMANPERPRLAPGLRAFFYGNYAIYYLVRHESVFIVRVLHGARDVDRIARYGGFLQ